jgi:hypothetical protein
MNRFSSLLGALLVGGIFAVGLFSSSSQAYPWIINHGYSSCTVCHVDPSGSGQLTAYGRGMADLIVRWHADPKDLESGEPSPTSSLLWGLVPEQPEWLNVSGNFRGGVGVNVPTSGNAAVFPVLMASDLYTTLNFGSFYAHATVGFGVKNVSPAVLVSWDNTRQAYGLQSEIPEYAITSREHWLGYKLFEDAVMIRAGRMPLPFGLRNNEHISMARLSTRTDINVNQQHGVSLGYYSDSLRAEIMGIAGNLQLAPDEYRERGYSGFVEWTPTTGLAVGASSLLVHATKDVDLGVERIRHAHGLFTRWAPMESLVLLAEADALISHASTTTVGGAGWAQLDWIPVQGIHIMPAADVIAGDALQPTMTGGWLSVAWYALPHVELRLDNLYRQQFTAGGGNGQFTTLLQLHTFL